MKINFEFRKQGGVPFLSSIIHICEAGRVTIWWQKNKVVQMVSERQGFKGSSCMPTLLDVWAQGDFQLELGVSTWDSKVSLGSMATN